MKAVLVIDMPQRCIDCPCSYVVVKYKKNICEVVGDRELSIGNMIDEKPQWCPLKPLDDELVYKQGWIDCFKQIIGRDE